jgi:hypothetical protein
MIVLTDGDNTMSDFAQNQVGGDPVPPLYVDSAGSGVAPEQWHGDGNPPSSDFSHVCRSVWHNSSSFPGDTDYDAPGLPSTSTAADNPERVNRLSAMDVAAYNLATTLKTTQKVEIYVLRYADPPGDNALAGGAGATCNSDATAQVSAATTNRTSTGSNDKWDQNLARCLASSTPGTNDHYFYAATPSQIQTAFQAIAGDIAFRLTQ